LLVAAVLTLLERLLTQEKGGVETSGVAVAFVLSLGSALVSDALAVLNAVGPLVLLEADAGDAVTDHRALREHQRDHAEHGSEQGVDESAMQSLMSSMLHETLLTRRGRVALHAALCGLLEVARLCGP